MSTACSASQFSVATEVTPANCTEGVGGSITVKVEGGEEPYTVNVEGQEPQMGDGPDFLFSNLEGDVDYVVDVTDSTSPNPKRSSEDVEVPLSDLSFELDKFFPDCEKDTLATVVVTVKDGALPFKVEVTDQDPQEGTALQRVFTFPNLPAGDYVVKVTDDDDCMRVDGSVEIPGSLDFTTTIVPENCEVGEKGTITVNVEGGIPPYKVEVEGQDTQSENAPSFVFANLDAGSYDVRVTDSNTDSESCEVTTTAVVPFSDLAFNVQVKPQCSEENGIIIVTVSGGVQPYKVEVTGQEPQEGPGDEPFIFPNLAAGKFEVTITDSEGCSRKTEVEVVLNDLEAKVEETPASFAENVGGTITVEVKGGKAPYTVRIESAEAVETETSDGPVFKFEGLDANTYTVTVTDSSECTSVNSATVLSDNDILNFTIVK